MKKSIDCIQHIFISRLMANYTFLAEGLVITITFTAEMILLVVSYDRIINLSHNSKPCTTLIIWPAGCSTSQTNVSSLSIVACRACGLQLNPTFNLPVSQWKPNLPLLLLLLLHTSHLCFQKACWALFFCLFFLFILQFYAILELHKQVTHRNVQVSVQLDLPTHLTAVWCVGPKQSGVTVSSKLRKWKCTLIIHDIKQGRDPERAHLQLNAGGGGDSSLFSMCLGNGVGEGWRMRGHQWTAAGVPQSQPSTCCYHIWQSGPGPGTNSLSLSEVGDVDCTHARVLWHVSDSSSIWTKHGRLLMCFFHVHWSAWISDE